MLRPDPMRTHRVLVTGMGGPAGIAFLHAAGRPDLEFVAVDMDACAAGLYLVPAGRRALVPPGDADDFVDALLHLCIAADVNVLVPTVDAELLPIARRRREFHDAGIALLMASEVTLGICLDKWQLAQTCAGRVDLPDTALLDRYFEPDAWTWPAIAKPRRGSGSRGVITVRDAEAARLLPSDGTLIVQELLPGLEYSLDVLAYPDGHVAAVVPRSRLRVDSG